MKTTSKILIGMGVAPFALLLLATIIFIAIMPDEGGKHKKQYSYDIEEHHTRPFSRVEFNFVPARVEVNVVHGNTPLVKIPDLMAYDVEDGTLTLRFDDDFNWEGMGRIDQITICTGSLDYLGFGGYGRCTLHNLAADSLSLVNADYVELDSCNYASVCISSTPYEGHSYYSCSDRLDAAIKASRIGTFTILDHYQYVDFTTPDGGRIDLLRWLSASHDYHSTEVAKANIGKISWQGGENQTLELTTKKNAEIIFDNDTTLRYQ